MAAPNLLSVTTVTPVTVDLALTGSAADLIPAAAGSHVYFVGPLFAANKTAAAHPVSLFHKKSGTSYEQALSMVIPANSTIALYDGAKFWLPDGESLTAQSDGSSQIVITGCYLDFS